MLEIARIRRDGGTQPRQGMNEDVVGDYVAALADGVQFPPIDVMFDGKDYWLYDGFHRIESHLRSGRTEIAARVVPGTLEEAQWRSYAANQSHGLRRSTADKERAIRSALKHPAAPGLSDRQIAKHLGVDNKTIAKYRAEMVAGEEIPQLTSRVGADGKTYETANIGKRPSDVAEKARQIEVWLLGKGWSGYAGNGQRGISKHGIAEFLWTSGDYVAKYDAVRTAEKYERGQIQPPAIESAVAAEQPPAQRRTLTLDETMALIWRTVKGYCPMPTASSEVRWRAYLDWLNVGREPRHFRDEVPEGTTLDGQLLINGIVIIRGELKKNLAHLARTEERREQHTEQQAFDAEVEKVKKSGPLPIYDLPPDLAEWDCKITSNTGWYFPALYINNDSSQSTTCADWDAAINWLRHKIEQRKAALAKKVAQRAPSLAADERVADAIVGIDVVGLLLAEVGGDAAGKREILIKLYELVQETFEVYSEIADALPPNQITQITLKSMIDKLKHIVEKS